MPSDHQDEVRDYGFADKALALRKRAGLTQRELASLLQVSVRAVHAWEGGTSYPGMAHLMHLITLYVDRGAFAAGREAEEAEGLWASVRASGARRVGPFDQTWFASLRGVTGGTPSAPPPPRPASIPTALAVPPPLVARTAKAAMPVPRHDWGEAPAESVLQGRAGELDTLARWVREERCRVVQVLGPGGIGKTALAARLAYDLAPEFPVVYWRSLRNALPVEEWLDGAISALSAAQALPPEGLEARLRQLLGLLRERRGLLVLDNLETILEPGAPGVRYRAGYEGYGEALRRLSESGHRGCLLLTSRERPLRADEPAMRALRLGGLEVEDGRVLLAGLGLDGDEAAWGTLVGRYGGNPLALKVVGEAIEAVFEGDVASFLAQEAAVFGDIRALLDEQLTRLSALERAVGIWLAVEREPVGFAELSVDLGPGVGRGELLEAVEGLRRRSLLEPGGRGTFTLQPVVLEYATAQLVAQASREVLAGAPGLLASHALVKAQSKDYVRRSQERLIAQPLLAELCATSDSAELERRLLSLLEAWRGRGREEQGYGPGNVVNLLRLLRGDLRGLDLARLSIRQAYLQEVEAQDANLADAHLSEAVLAEAFTVPTSLALSADGASLVAGTSTGELCLWRVADRMPLTVVQVHTGWILDAAISMDGRLVASASHDGTVRLWEAPSGRPLATLQGHTGAAWGVALSQDGRLAASASADGTVRLWESQGGRPLATLQGHTGAVWRAALSGDGRLLASGGEDGTVRLWEVPSGRPLATLQGHAGGIWGLTLSGDGGLLASGGEDGTVRLWEVPSGRPLATLQGHMGAVWRAALSGDGRLLASGGRDGTVKLWEAAPASGSPGRLLATLQGHTGGVWGLALSGNGGLVASASEDGTVKLWGEPSGRPLATLQGHTSGVWSVALSGDGRLLASGGRDGKVRLWEAAPANGSQGRPLATLQGHTSGVWGVALSGDGQFVASASFDGTVRLWEAPSGRPLATLQGHTNGVWSVAVSADGRLVASGSHDGTVRLWEAASGRPLATMDGHTGVARGVALSGDGRLLASGSEDGSVRLWEVTTGQLLATMEGHTGAVYGVALSADGRLVASGSHDGTVRLWEPASGRPLATLEGHSSGVYGVALSGDRRLLASGSWDGTVRLWDAASGRPLATLQGHTGLVHDVTLSEDGALMASASEDGTVRLWEAPGGACLRTLRSDRPYERTDITGLTGVTDAQRSALLALGAVENRV